MSSALETEIAKLRAEIAELSAGARKAGHDLNNVLQALICEAERLADSDLPRAQVISETILTAVTRGEEVTRALLAAGHASARPMPPTPTLPAAVASFTYGPARILVVEDQEQNSDFLWKILQTAGHTVVVAGNGAEAVAAIELAPFDLVLMDIEMPLMDGLAATRAIRRMEGIGRCRFSCSRHWNWTKSGGWFHPATRSSRWPPMRHLRAAMRPPCAWRGARRSGSAPSSASWARATPSTHCAKSSVAGPNAASSG